MSIAYYNGRISRPEEVTISLNDRCVFFGDGVYDAAIGTTRGIHQLDEHVERFIRGAKQLAIPLPYEAASLKPLLISLTKQSEEAVYMVYFQLTRRLEKRLHSAKGIIASNLLITVTPCAMPTPDERVILFSYPDKRYSYCNIKTLNLLPSVLASTYADEKGGNEAVFVRDGIVTECAHSNLSLIKNGTLYTHPESDKILSGITRKHLLIKAREVGIPVVEKRFGLGELYMADEVIITSSTRLARLAAQVDGIRYEIKEGSIGKQIAEKLFCEFVENV